MFDCKIIADSMGLYGDRLTTMIVTYPRIIHSEVMTHRMLSKNSASSRAIPFEKMVKTVKENPFIPIAWQKDHKGMQGNEYFAGDLYTNTLMNNWLNARDQAIHYAEYLNKSGLTKQLCNRILEPYSWITVIISATEWDNFFALRVHPDAEIHLQKIATMMLEEYNKSEPKQLYPGDWHIPFSDNLDLEKLKEATATEENPLDRTRTAIKIAIARCARISYLNFEGKNDYLADIKLHDRLLESKHFSPFEHVCMVGDNEWYGNMHGFKPYRKFIQGENQSDNRVIKK